MSTRAGIRICSTISARSIPSLSSPGFYIHMASQRVLQYVTGAKNKPPTVYLRCHVKPGASKVREGITALTDSTIELCVAAVPKDGESNKAVLAVLSEVSESFTLTQALCRPVHLGAMPVSVVSGASVPGSTSLACSRRADTGLRHSTSQSQTCKSLEAPSPETKSSLLLARPSRTTRRSASVGF